LGCQAGSYLSITITSGVYSGTCTSCSSTSNLVTQCNSSTVHTVCQVGYFTVLPFAAVCASGTGIVTNNAVASQYVANVASACAPGYFIASAGTATTTCTLCG